MKQHQGIIGGLLLGGATVILASAPVWAAPTQVTGVQLRPTSRGVDVLLQIESGDRPQIFTVSNGNAQVADIINTQLRLPQGNMFRQDNPAPGISSVVVTQLDANSVRVIVSGTTSAPAGQLSARDDRGIVFSFNSSSGNTAEGPFPNVPPPPSLPSLNQEPMAQTPPPLPPQPEPTAQIAVTPPQEVLVPNPEIRIDGVPADPAVNAPPPAISPNVAPPFLPRAIAPPLGDIAISNIDSSPTNLELGTGERVPRLVLRDAPVRDVLALLARAAGLNLAFTGSAALPQGQPGQTQPGQPTAGLEGPTISLDIENEPVQDVFNYILRLSGLQANRSGRTIFVGTQLPLGASNTSMRSLRLNQASATAAANFLVGQGAELQLPITRVQLVPLGTGANQTISRIEEPDIKVIKAQQGAGPLVLSGLSVVADQRLNSITLVGDPRKIEIASALLSQLDLRQRQVAVNVKVVDVNLSGVDNFNTSFSFGIGDFYFSTGEEGAAAGYGPVRPPTSSELNNSLTTRPTITNPYTGEPFLNNPFFNSSGNTNPDGRPQASPPLDPRGNPTQPGITDFTPGTPEVRTTTFGQIGIDANGNPIQGQIENVTPGTPDTYTYGLPSLFQFPKRFLSALRAQILSRNAKILTDPTLIVQENQVATVDLTQDVVSRVTTTTTETPGGGTRDVREPEFQAVGLQLSVSVVRIDDNGFVTMVVNPTVSSPQARVTISSSEFATPIQRRSLSSGQVRIRDGQTLVLSGIIQETDRTEVSKVPILGDLPLIGSLFRRTSRTNERAEVIVLVTPQIMDDSERSPYGYGYRPGREVIPLLQRQTLPSGGNQ